MTKTSLLAFEFPRNVSVKALINLRCCTMRSRCSAVNVLDIAAVLEGAWVLDD
ncbi:hypothetical protein SERLA73DRAFT_148416 [Serpula lacrymans var. lacrymans S7.3]|uniref:Uncharacterized protein n=2 Tax=Serpula lacrymans var. lacrymans TaxID=341189 RepID=F8QJE0_SERL3|nr:uncharacterized protein SERLADRAFT_379549 [Serpula lacrymans var. lacrymans S7.9]EGN91581.1 hypothetical protein SERLA73DRAFT_148416 [Serpula lacrymans var. lacrymans S7.3]EGO29947.1 hypothetical protein SERLADRAFT_379549 [Serpula lacrymans var. lacrymans S7.9]